MNHKLGYTYLPEEKVYCLQRGDTNYLQVTVKGGFRSDDGLYILFVQDVYSPGESDIPDMIVTLLREGNDYRFLSVSR